ncbi:MAG: polyprenyl synthetase family protein [Saprospiraceae bacterium]|nr:polyprenyl synthetase family protein [Saprospiraceae bacterium]
MIDLQEYRNEFEKFSQNQTFSQGPDNLNAPIRYIMGIPGKRIRPVLCLMATRFFGGDLSETLPIAYAVELFHNFSLVHDDIMDEAPLRRGFETVHLKYGLNSGILSGDAMQIYVYDYILNAGFSMEVTQSLLRTFTKTAIEVCEGQQMDIDFEKEDDVTEKAYLEMIDKKTAALLWASLSMGSIPFVEKEKADTLGKFGRNLGMAFQLRDDYLDTFGSSEHIGKQVGGDIIQGKKTLLYIWTLSQLEPAESSWLKKIYSENALPDDQKVQQVKDLFIKYGADKEILARIAAFERQSEENLLELEREGFDTRGFSQLSDYLMNRVS